MEDPASTSSEPPLHYWGGKRAYVLRLSSTTDLKIADIVERVGLSRSTVFRYRALYRAGGYEALMRNKVAGRPRESSSDIDAIVANGLRYLHWLHAPALQDYVRIYCNRLLPIWTIRRLARRWEQKLGFPLSRKRRYVKGELAPYRESISKQDWWLRKLDYHGIPYVELSFAKRDAELAGGQIPHPRLKHGWQVFKSLHSGVSTDDAISALNVPTPPFSDGGKSVFVSGRVRSKSKSLRGPFSLKKINLKKNTAIVRTPAHGADTER